MLNAATEKDGEVNLVLFEQIKEIKELKTEKKTYRNQKCSCVMT